MSAVSDPGPFPPAVPDSWAWAAWRTSLARWFRRWPPSVWMVLAAVALGLGGGLAALTLAPRARAAPGAEAIVPAAVRVSVTTGAPPPLLVHVAGAVARPGLYQLRPGARVADALNAAGGARDDADVTRVNLAAPVADGARVYVPAPGEMPPPVVAASTSGADAVTAGGATAPTGGEVDPVDLNNATEQQLEALPGVGPATAQAIIRQREAHPFASVDDLLTVRGIGPAKLETLRPHVRV